jgi:hypothetical protein
MTTTPLDVELSGIAIVDGLTPTERAKHGDTMKLRATISGVAPEYLGPTFNCDNKADYWHALHSLVAAATRGVYYMLHFECHGCPDGIQIGTDVVTWAEQASELAALNSAMRGQLVINMSACNGIHASKVAGVDPKHPPFYAAIGPAKTIEMTCVSVVVNAFYSEYLGGSSGRLDAAILATNSKLKFNVLLGIRSEVFLHEQSSGYPFRPGAADSEMLSCRPDGTLYVEPTIP